MVPLSALWLPILVSAVFVFIASNILWMALPFWHRKDYSRPADDRVFVEAAKPLRSGLYIFPFVDWRNATPETKAKIASEPAGVMIIRNPNKFSFGLTLLGYFLYTLFVSAIVGYLTGVAVPPGAPYLHVHRIAGTAGMLAWAFGVGNISDSLWYGKPWSVTIKTIVDGIIYGLLIGGTFGWLWPR